MAITVRFYQRPEYMAFLSDKEGRPIHEMRDYVRIEIPGIVANVVDTLAGDHHKQEHPVEWARYLADKDKGEFHDGTLLDDWPQLNAAQVLGMRHTRFYTVEQVAEASDQQIMAIGMLAGMSPLSLRDKAKAWLEHAKERSAEKLALAAQEQAIAERDELKGQVAQLRKLVESLAQKKKGGRPRKTQPKTETASA